MNIVATYPVLTYGKTPNGKAVKAALITDTQEFDIPVVRPEDAPVAFRIESRWMEFDEIRVIEGRLHRRSKLRLEATDDHHARWLLDTGELKAPFGQLTSMMIKEIDATRIGRAAAFRGETQGREVLPAKIDAEITNGNFGREQRPELVADVVALTGNFIVDNEGRNEIEHWRRVAAEIVSGFALVGEEVWVPCGEPLYVIKTRTTSEIAVTFPEMYPTVYQRASTTLPEDARVFSAMDLEEALATHAAAWPDAQGNAHNARLENARIEVLIPQEMSADIDRLELDRLARILAVDVAASITNGCRSKPDFLNFVSGDVLASYARLRDTVAGHRPLDNFDADELAERLGDLVVAVREHRVVLGGLSVCPPQVLADAEEILARWQAREISVEFGLLALPRLGL